MKRLTLTYACEDYDLHRAIVDGSIHPEGVDIRAQLVDSYERNERMTRGLQYDLAEFSMSVYLAGVAAGLPLVALPVFPRRMFVHRYMFIHTQAGIEGPHDLAGRRIGIVRHQNTLALVARGMLHDQYGLDLASVRWVTGRPETYERGSMGGFQFESAPEGTRLESLLVAGEIDALMIPETIGAWDRRDPGVARLFPDFKQAEQAYYRATGIFPIMHVLVARRELLEREPWLAESLVTAFARAQERAFDGLGKPATVSLAWARALHEEESAFFGEHPWPVGVRRNAAALRATVRWSHLLGLIPRELQLAELFPFEPADAERGGPAAAAQ